MGCALSRLTWLALLALAGGWASGQVAENRDAASSPTTVPDHASRAASQVSEIRDAAELNRLVSQTTTQPVLVDFYKEGCEKCLAFEEQLNRLSGQYAGRVVVAKFMLMRAAKGVVTAPAVAEKYDIYFYPTVILFVGGAVKKEFVTTYNIADYCAAIDAQLQAVPSSQRADH